MAIALAAFAPGVAYLYLPAVLDFIPERLYAASVDPRTLNRQPVPPDHVAEFLSSPFGADQAELLRQLLGLGISPGDSRERRSDVVSLIEESGLLLTRGDCGLYMAANFSTTDRIELDPVTARSMGADGVSFTLEPLAYVIQRSASVKR